MDNAQKAIMIGVGLFITIIVIAAVMLITGMGQDMLTSGQQQVSNISSSLQAQLTSDFDGTTLTGAQVIAAVRRYCTDDNMVIKVRAVKNGTSYDYGKIQAVNLVKVTSGTPGSIYYNIKWQATGTKPYDAGTTATKIGRLSDTSSGNKDYYVPSSAKYEANVIRLSGNTVIGIIFERK